MEAFELFNEKSNVKTEKIKNKFSKTSDKTGATTMSAKNYYRHKEPDYDNILE